MSVFVGVGGVSKSLATLKVGVSGVYKSLAGEWVGVGGVWKQLYAAFTVSPQNVGTDGGPSGSIQWRTDGTIVNEIGDVSYWGTPTTPGIGSSYWLKVHLTSGSNTGTSGVTLDTWVHLDTNQQRSIVAPPVGARTANYTYSISTSASDAGIIGSASAVLSAAN